MVIVRNDIFSRNRSFFSEVVHRLARRAMSPTPPWRANHPRVKQPTAKKGEPRMDTNRDGPPSMTNRARMYLRYRDLDIPTSWEGATRERGRPARNPIHAGSLRSRGIPSNSAPNPPLQGSLLWCQVLCGRDARAPGWAFSHSLLLLKRACRVAGPQPCRADHAREPLAILAVGQVILPVNVIFCLFQ